MPRVAFVHLDLGIGGAEKLMVDAGIALKSKNHDVMFFTTHHDPTHCFPPTSDGTLPVICRGDFLPRSIFGKAYALCSYIRIIYLALYILLFYKNKYDVIVSDIISVSVPILKLSARKVLFYCHFPDQLLTQRKSKLKKLYRKPLDKLEEWTIGKANTVFVNSNYTKTVFRDTFKSLTNLDPIVLYPSIDLSQYKVPDDPGNDVLLQVLECNNFTFLSINRYERKKNVMLALEALSLLNPNNDNNKNGDTRLTEDEYERTHLIIAGGYDLRVTENKEYYRELFQRSCELKIESKVTFLRSLCSPVKNYLLHHCFTLLYTPEYEHFGIVPIEAMYLQTPVIACNSGGPCETIVHGQTGMLCDSNPEEYSRCMWEMIRGEEKDRRAYTMGMVGKQHVTSQFSFQKFTDTLNSFVV